MRKGRPHEDQRLGDDESLGRARRRAEIDDLGACSADARPAQRREEGVSPRCCLGAAEHDTARSEARELLDESARSATSPPDDANRQTGRRLGEARL